MTRMLHKLVIAGLMALLVAACGGNSGPERPRDFAFAAEGPLTLTVRRVEVIDSYFPAMKSPYVDHEFRVPPIKALHRWARQRFRPSGTTGTLKIILVDAAVIEEKLHPQSGMMDFLVDDQAFGFNGRVTVKLVYLPDGEVPSGQIEAHSYQRRTIPESATVNDRVHAWREMTWFLIDALDQAVRNKIADHMVDLIAQPDRHRLRSGRLHNPDAAPASTDQSVTSDPPASQTNDPAAHHRPQAARR